MSLCCVSKLKANYEWTTKVQQIMHHWCYLATEVLVNSLAPGKFEWNFIYVIFKWILVIDGWGISYEIALISMHWTSWWSVNIGSGNGLVPSANVDPDLCHHMASLGHKELILHRMYVNTDQSEDLKLHSIFHDGLSNILHLQNSLSWFAFFYCKQ